MKPRVTRRAQRHQVYLEVKELNGQPVTDTRILDISTVGVRLESSLPLEPKSPIEFTFHQPSESTETRVSGTVVWMKAAEGKPGRYYLGVEFHNSFLAQGQAPAARPDQATGGADSTRVVSFFGSKGGVGNTFLTINIAYLLAREKVGKVLVVDLDLLYGQALYFFDATPKHTILDVIENFEDLDSSYLHKLVHHCHDYLSLLPAPQRLEDAETVTPVQVRKILHYLKNLQEFKWIFIDCPHHLGEVALTALESSDQIFLTTAPSLPALSNAKKVLKLLDVLGLREDKVAVILNSVQKHKGLMDAEAQKFLGQEIAYKIGFAPIEVDISIEEGKPLGATAPKVAMSLGLKTIADKFLGTDINHLPTPGRWSRLKDMIKKP